MPAKITVRAELASLLAKSQELTDANRQAQLKKEADRREDQKRLKAKKANEDAARRKPLEDPVGRNIFTAAAGGVPPLQLGSFWWDSKVGRSNRTDVRVWSADGTASASIPWLLNGYPPNFGWVGDDFALTRNPSLFLATFGRNTYTGYTHGVRYATIIAPGYVFPVNSETAILLILWSVARGWYAAGVTFDFGLPPFPEDLPTNPDGSLVFPPNSAYQAGNNNTQFLPLGYKVGFGGYIYEQGEAAFLVGKSTVRQITVPSFIASRPVGVVAATARVQAMAPGTAGGIAPRELEDDPLPGMVSVPSYTGNPSDNFFAMPSSFNLNLGIGLNQRFNDIQGPTPGSFLITVRGPEEMLSFNRRQVPGPLSYAQRKSYAPWGGTLQETAFFGRSTLLDDEGQREFGSPSIGTAAFQMSDANYSALLAGSTPARFNYTDPRLRRVKYKEGTTPVRPADYPLDLYNEGNIMFWDWGKPGFCRQQLLQMGFAEADLIPTPPPP